MKQLAPLGFFILTLLVFGSPVQAQGLWSPPEPLGYGWWQSIAVDQTGTAHISWNGSVSETVNGRQVINDLLMYARRSWEGTWTPPIDVVFTGSGGYTVRNTIAVNRKGIISVFFRGGIDHELVQAPAVAAENAANWTPPFIINRGYYLDMLLDKQGILHIFSSGGGEFDEQAALLDVGGDRPTCLQCADLLYRRSIDEGQTWSLPVNLTESQNGVDKIDAWQGVGSDRLYVNWDAGVDWYAGRAGYQNGYLIYSEDEGQTWSDPIIFDGIPDLAPQPAQLSVTELQDGTLMAVWRSSQRDSAIYYQMSVDRGATWSEPEPIPILISRKGGETPLDDYELLTDHTGIVHLFAVATTATINESSLFHVEYRQGQWRAPTVIFPGTENERPEWPKADVGPQNDLHLTWFTRLLDEEPGRNLMVYYSHRAGTMLQQPTEAFEPTPTVVEIVIQAPLLPTPTAYPTVEPLSGYNVRTNADLYASETLILAFVACAVVCSLIFGVYRIILRR